MFWGSFESSNLSVSGLLPSKYYCFLCGMGSLPSNYHSIKKVANCFQHIGILPSKFILALCLQNLLLLCNVGFLNYHSIKKVEYIPISMDILPSKFLFLFWCLQTLFNYTACLSWSVISFVMAYCFWSLAVAIDILLSNYRPLGPDIHEDITDWV